VEKDPFLNFISDLSEKIRINREHKQIMERGNDSKVSGDESKASLDNLILTIKQKIESTVTTKESVPALSTTQTTPLTSSIVKVVSEEESNFQDFVGKLKGILDKPREMSADAASTSSVSSVSASAVKSEEQQDVKKYVNVLNQPKTNNNKKTQNYVEELEKIKDGIQVEKEDTKVTEIEKLIEEYAEKYIKKAVGMMGESGGGTNAVQYANGGIMNGNLNVNGNYLSGGVNLLDIFASQPDSDNQTLSFNESDAQLSISNGNTVSLSAINTTFKANSGKYESNYTTTNSNSANWSKAYSNLTSNSAAYLSGYDLSALAAASGSWNSNYTTTNSNSANWSEAYSNLTSNSAAYLSGYDLSALAAASGSWNSNYTTTNSNSANWSEAYSNLTSNSANWSGAYTTFNANSSFYDAAVNELFTYVISETGDEFITEDSLLMVDSNIAGYPAWNSTTDTVVGLSAGWSRSSAFASLSFGSVSARCYADQYISLNGAAIGDAVFVACTSVDRTINPFDVNLFFDCLVSSANTITIRAHNPTNDLINNTITYDYRVILFK